ncbi:ATP-binding protein [Streptomyces sp. NPDC040750]|uniref:ATP-binding protein n=1 Tax=Streptomyces sp. NPDC040750 TaxID=3154491 RepID=UPI0033EA138E
MASPAIGLAEAPRRERFAWLLRRRNGQRTRSTSADRADRQGQPSKAAPTSWLARQWALWSRTLEPLRPLDAPRGRATAWDASWPLKRELASAGQARGLVIGQLDDWHLTDIADTAALLVSELVTNALRHTRGPLRLNLQVRDGRLRCEVEDTDSGGPVRRTVDTDAESGRGMELVDLLAEAWGGTRTPTGKTVWFELTAQPPAST